MDGNIEDVFSYVLNNRESLTDALKGYKHSPHEVRNMAAELGTEMTPDELKELCALLEKVLNQLDEMDQDYE